MNAFLDGSGFLTSKAPLGSDVSLIVMIVAAVLFTDRLAAGGAQGPRGAPLGDDRGGDPQPHPRRDLDDQVLRVLRPPRAAGAARPEPLRPDRAARRSWAPSACCSACSWRCAATSSSRRRCASRTTRRSCGRPTRSTWPAPCWASSSTSWSTPACDGGRRRRPPGQGGRRGWPMSSPPRRRPGRRPLDLVPHSRPAHPRAQHRHPAGAAVFLGHSRDTRMFMATGYLVGTGHSPYASMDLTGVFHHVGFKSISVIGYPPPWPLVLGGIYRGFYAAGHHLLVYNFAHQAAGDRGHRRRSPTWWPPIAQNLGAGPAGRRAAGLDRRSCSTRSLLYVGGGLGPDRRHRGAARAGRAGAARLSRPRPLRRGAGARRLLQADRRARPARRARLPAGPVGVAGGALRRRLPRRGVRLLRRARSCCWAGARRRCGSSTRSS